MKCSVSHWSLSKIFMSVTLPIILARAAGCLVPQEPKIDGTRGGDITMKDISGKLAARDGM